MYKEMSPKIISEMIKVLLISFLVGLVDIAILDYTIIETIVGMVFVNLLLFMAYWYTTTTRRPILFITLFTFYLGLGIYAMRYLEEDYVAFAAKQFYVPKGTGILLIQGCVIVLLLEGRELISIIKGRIDYWVPPVITIIIVAFLFLEFDINIESRIRRFSILILILGVVIASFDKNRQKERKDIYYNVSLKGYFSHLTMLLLIMIIGVIYLPKMESLPGAKYIQKLNKSIIGDVQTEIHLDRKPELTDQLIYTVKSDEPLYLREAAYDYYQHGTWKMSKTDNEYHILEEDTLIEESDLVSLALASEGIEQTQKSAYIYEVQDQKNFLTTNGTTQINIEEQDNIIYYDNKSHICFTEAKEKGQRAYTINYVDRKALKKLFINGGRISREELLEENEKYATIMGIDLVEGKDYLTDEEYRDIVERYTQLPMELSTNSRLEALAIQLAGSTSSPAQAASNIEAYLKYNERFSYVLGASYMDTRCDPVYDFLFNKSEGICQDFASSMVILCRELNIPARYVVGYYSTESNQNGEYLVRQRHGHAFVEVYVIGYGWMLFDPTPTDMNRIGIAGNQGEASTEKSSNVNNAFNLSITISIVLALATIIVLFVRIVSEYIWRRRMLRVSNKQAIDEIVDKMLKVLELKEYPILEGETLLELTDRFLKKGIDLSPITKPYNDCYYGRRKVTRIEIEKALICYKKLCGHKIWRELKKLG